MSDLLFVKLYSENLENNQDNWDPDDRTIPDQVLDLLLKRFIDPPQKEAWTLLIEIKQMGKEYKLCIPLSNIAHAVIGDSYHEDRFLRWEKYKKQGKKIIKVFAIIMGLILAITQIVVNVVTIS